MNASHFEIQSSQIGEPELLGQDLEQVPERYRESLIRTQEIADSVGSDIGVYAVDSMTDVAVEPGAYLFRNNIDSVKYRDVRGVKFDVDPKSLSGKVDSAHAVLPGILSVLHVVNHHLVETRTPVAAKGFYKRELADRFDRVTSEVQVSQKQAAQGELAYSPIAVVVAPSEAGHDYDLLLVTKLDESAVSLDNAPWQLGFTSANLELAETAVSALGRFNATVGMHGDAKIKNISQHPDGQASMIDFETSKEARQIDPLNAATIVHEDLSKLLVSLIEPSFFNQDPYRARDVLEQLGQTYLEQWSDSPQEVQETVYEQAVRVLDDCHNEVMRKARLNY